MAHVDDLDAFIDATVIDIDDMTAAERPDHLDAFVFERLSDKMPAGDDRSGRFLFGFGIYWRCHGYLVWFFDLLSASTRRLTCDREASARSATAKYVYPRCRPFLISGLTH